MTILFYLAAIIAIFASIMVVTRTNIVHALLYMIVSLLASAVIFFLVGAPFVAALEVIIYAGAITVLFVFVVMMLNLGQKTVQQEKQWLSGSGWPIPTLLVLILLAEFIYLLVTGNSVAIQGAAVSPKAVGTALFTRFLIGVELAAFLLLAGIIGAYHLARRKKKVVHRFLQVEGTEE